MASEQELVRDAWLAARKGNLCALSECKAWALREVWREQKGPKARRILRVKNLYCIEVHIFLREHDYFQIGLRLTPV